MCTESSALTALVILSLYPTLFMLVIASHSSVKIDLDRSLTSRARFMVQVGMAHWSSLVVPSTPIPNSSAPARLGYLTKRSATPRTPGYMLRQS
jgi:hypothetical protein